MWIVQLTDTVLPYKRHIPSLLQLSTQEAEGLARILKRVLVRYDNLFSSVPFWLVRCTWR